jgi:hypothetical protein
MEQLLIQTAVQQGPHGVPFWVCAWGTWNWLFWAGTLVGIVGAGIQFLMNPTELG